MQFQGRICPETFHLDKIENGALVIIVDFNMRNIWKTVPDNQNITIEQNVRFLRGLYPEKYQPSYILNGRLMAIFSPPFN